MPQDSSDLPPGARVLFVRLSALGDVIFALESVASLKAERPDVLIDFLVEDRFAEVLRDQQGIDTVLQSPRRRKLQLPGFLWRLRRRRYDAVLDLHGILKSALHVWMTRAPLKLGYTAPGAREGASLVYNRKVPLPSPLPHRAERGYYLLQALGLRGARHAPLLLGGDDFDTAQRRGVILHPGSSAFAAFKRWPLDKFAELARRLTERGLPVSVSFGPGEEGLAETLRRAVPAVVPIDGRGLGLLGLARQIQRAQVLVAADTGPLHIAAAVGTPVVALFGPKDAELYGPRGMQQRVVTHDVPCRPCRRRRCASPQCILGVPVDRVEASVQELCSG
ncbi:MAG: glycosyltransferase family 9 protein [Planctomycetes bacterium]|nr:glycosyltransferase family 9 protein [Planctomycetota bacterium]